MYTLKEQGVGLFNSIDELVDYVLDNGVDPEDSVIYIDGDMVEHDEGPLVEYIVF